MFLWSPTLIHGPRLAETATGREASPIHVLRADGVWELHCAGLGADADGECEDKNASTAIISRIIRRLLVFSFSLYASKGPS